MRDHGLNIKMFILSELTDRHKALLCGIKRFRNATHKNLKIPPWTDVSTVWAQTSVPVYLAFTHELPARSPVFTWGWDLLVQGAAADIKMLFFVKGLDMGRVRKSAREMQSVQPRKGISSSWVTTTKIQVHWSSPMEKTDPPAPLPSLNTSTRAWGCGLGILPCSEQHLCHGSSPPRPARTRFIMSQIKAAQQCTCISPVPVLWHITCLTPGTATGTGPCSGIPLPQAKRNKREEMGITETRT